MASSYQGYYVGLLSLLRNYDGMLSSTVFCGLSSGIQNDLINSITEVLFTEIKKSPRAIIMDVTQISQISAWCQLCFVTSISRKPFKKELLVLAILDTLDRTANAWQTTY